MAERACEGKVALVTGASKGTTSVGMRQMAGKVALVTGASKGGTTEGTTSPVAI